MVELASEAAGEDVSFNRSEKELIEILNKNGGKALPG